MSASPAADASPNVKREEELLKILNDTGRSDDESLWELTALLPLTTDLTCDTCGRRAVATWAEHGSKRNALAQCLTCQTIRFMHLYDGPHKEWPPGTLRIRTDAPSDLGQLLLAKVSDFDPRSIGDTPQCMECGDKIKPAREDAVVVLRPCCGKMTCVDCAKPVRDAFGRSECTLCHDSMSGPVKENHDNFIIHGKCGHAYHFDCLNKNFDCLDGDSRVLHRCPECPERWEASERYIVAHRCSCGEELLALPGDEDDIVLLLLKKAADGHGYAQYFLGLHHCDLSTFHFGEKKTLEVGINLLESAMENGYVPAFRMLARIHCEGIGEVEKSTENANNLFNGIVDEEMAKCLAPIEAEVSLATAKCYREAGDRYNFVQYVKRAAQKGNAEAIGILGTLYLGSKLKTKDEIIEMFQIAAANGDQTCRSKYRFHLANIFREEGDIAEYIENLKWASYSGHVEATYLVGSYYLVGLYGCKKDPDMARLYLDRARGMGHAVAKDVICARLTKSFQLVVYFGFDKTQSICINIDPNATIRTAREMVQFETGVSADAFHLESTNGEQHLTDDTLVDEIFWDGLDDMPPYRRETFLCSRATCSGAFPGVELFGSCGGWEYTELKTVDAIQYLDELLLPLSHYMMGCSNPKCETCTAGVSAYSEQAQHAAICCQRASGGCRVCKKFWELIKSHALRCLDAQCRIPGCKMWKKKREDAFRQLKV